MKEKNISDVAAYQMEDGTFDLYLKTDKGKRYVHADKDFRTFEEDSLEASADEILWQRDTATINGKLVEGNDFRDSGHPSQLYPCLAQGSGLRKAKDNRLNCLITRLILGLHR